MRIDNNLSNALVVLRLPLAFLIVAGHANVLMFPLMSGGNPIIYCSCWIRYPIHLLSQVLFSSAVPLFFTISGFLFFAGIQKYDKHEYLTKIKKRARSLLLPYIVWNVLYWIEPISKWLTNGDSIDFLWLLESLWILPNQEPLINHMQMTTPADPPLWFIRDLMVCMILSPIIWGLLRRTFYACIYLLCLAVPWILKLNIMFPFPGISFSAVLFFSIGSYLAISRFDISKSLSIRVVYLPIFFAYFLFAIIEILTFSYTIENNVSGKLSHFTIIYSILSILGCLLFVAIALVCTKNKRLNKEKWGGAFSVYAVHMIIIDFWKVLIDRVLPQEISEEFALAIYIIMILSGFLCGVLVNYIISKNRILQILFAGGRS